MKDKRYYADFDLIFSNTSQTKQLLSENQSPKSILRKYKTRSTVAITAINLNHRHRIIVQTANFISIISKTIHVDKIIGKKVFFSFIHRRNVSIF